MASSLAEVQDLFEAVEGMERIELLLEYTDALPQLPASYAALRDAGLGAVHECQSPVFLLVEGDAGCIRIWADVPRESPTARGFVGLLHALFDGASAEGILSAPPDLLHTLGLAPLLGMQRSRGLRAIYARLRAETLRRSAG